MLIGMLIWKATDQNDPVQAARVQPSVQNLDNFAADPFLNNYVPEPTELLRDESNKPEDPEFKLQPAKLSAEKTSRRGRTYGGKYRRKVTEPSRKFPEFERIVIPSLKVNASIISKPYSELTWDLSTLGQDVALLEDIPNQTSENNIVFAGHVTVRNGSHGPFRYLWKLNPGDEIILHNENMSYTYIVRDQVLVYPEDSSVLNDTAQPQLTLITCTTWDEETLSYLRRLVIFADLKKVETRYLFVD